MQMSKVTGATLKSPSGPFWYWTELGPKNINLADTSATLPAGTYELYWDFRGKPGDSLDAKVTDDQGRVLVTLTDTIAANDSESWGQKSFKVL
jgi:hypothetical protein